MDIGPPAGLVTADQDIAIEVTWGEELYAPIQYHSFRIGPLVARTTCKPGENLSEIVKSLHHVLQVSAREIFREKSVEYLQHMAEIGMLVRQGAAK